VRSRGDRWRDIQKKVTEYLQAGVLTVIALDPASNSAHVFSADDPPKTLGADDDPIRPGILEGFRVRPGLFFG
jgi:Uma2 family endonuclease